MSTSESLQMAMDLDPDGKRTLGVITKIDIMDKGTDASSMLLNEDIPLKLGYVGVKGRSQLDIKQKVKVRDALREENKYFSEHPVYSTLPADCVGTQSLVQKLTEVLYALIKENLPLIKSEISRKKEESLRKLKDLGPGLPGTDKDKFEFVWGLSDQLCSLLLSELQGKYDLKREEMNRKRRDKETMSITSKIHEDFDEFLEDYASTNFQVTEKHSDEEIFDVIVTYQGDNLPGFPSMEAFKHLIVPKLDMLKAPTSSLLDNIIEKMDELIKDSCAFIFKRFPALEAEIYEILNKELASKKETTRILLMNLLDCEENYIFTNEPNFLAGDLQKFVDQSKKKKKVVNEFDRAKHANVENLRNRVDAYFFIVSRNLKDMAPKIIGNFIIHSMMRDVKFVLFNNISKANSFLSRMNEPSESANERDRLTKQLDVLKKAERRLMADPGDEDIYQLLEKKNQEFNQSKLEFYPASLGNLQDKQALRGPQTSSVAEEDTSVRQMHRTPSNPQPTTGGAPSPVRTNPPAGGQTQQPSQPGVSSKAANLFGKTG